MKSRFSEEQIIGILKQQEHGMKVADVRREHNISQNTFYAWNTPRGHPVWWNEGERSSTPSATGSRERQAQTNCG